MKTVGGHRPNSVSAFKEKRTLEMPKSEIINFHHIGARSGSAVPVLRLLGKEQAIWLYDADESCVDQVKYLYKDSTIPVSIFPFFISEKPGAIDFNLNYDPYTSSLFSNSENLNGAYAASENDNGDYLISTAFSKVRTVPLQAETLDNLSDAEGFSVDYLSLDVQGCELNILNGARKVLEQQCLVISTEILFAEFYNGQPCADEIFAFCRKNNFRLMRIETHEDSSWFRGPIGWRGRGATFFGDALFYKDPKVIRETHDNWNISLKKMAMIALVGGYFEFCLECLLLCDDTGTARASDRNSTFKYVRILAGLRDIYDEERHIYAPSFPEIFSLEESYERFQNNTLQVGGYNLENLRERYFAAMPLTVFKDYFPKLCADEPSKLEQYLIDNSLSLTANAFRERRLASAQSAARLLGFVGTDGRIDLTILDRLT